MDVESTTGRFNEIRRELVYVLVLSLLVLGGLAAIPSIYVAWNAGLYSIVAVDLGLYVFGLSVWAVRHRMPYGVVAGGAVAVLAILGAALFVVLGFNGSGKEWLIAACSVAALLIGWRTTVFCLIWMAAFVLLVPVWIAPGGLAGPPFSNPQTLLLACNAIAVALILSISTLALLTRLRHATLRVERQKEALEQERRALAQANASLRSEMQERSRAEERLHRAERMGAIGTLASGIAHDFNNLLTPIIMATETLRLDERDPERRELLELVEQAAQQGEGLVQRIVAVSREPEGSRTPHDAEQVISEGVEVLRAALPDSVRLSVHVSPEVGLIAITGNEAGQLLLSLGTNAVEALDGSGELEIRVRPLVSDGERWVELIVSDSGPGMSPEVAERALDPFFTTRRSQGAKGLGLSAVRALVISVGGRVRLCSVDGDSSRVQVLLPDLSA